MQAVLDSTLLTFSSPQMNSHDYYGYGIQYDEKQPRMGPGGHAHTHNNLIHQIPSLPSSSSSSLICILSPLGTILSTSPSSINLLNAYPESITGTSIMDYVHPQDLDQFISSMSAIISNGSSLQMIYRLKGNDSSSAYRLFEGFGRPINEDEDGFQGQGMVLISKLSTNDEENDSIWSRRQAARVQKGLPPTHQQITIQTTGAPMSGPTTSTTTASMPTSATSIPTSATSIHSLPSASLQSSFSTSGTSSSTPIPSSTPSTIISIDGTIYHSPLSATTTAGYPSIEEDLSHTSSSSSSLLSTINNPLSSTPSLISFDDSTSASNSTSWTIDSQPSTTPALYSKSYSYFDISNDSLDDLKSPRAKDDSMVNQYPLEHHSYWDNITNSELVSPNFFIPGPTSTSTPTTTSNLLSTTTPTPSYFDSAAQARAKSYSLPGLFDINAQFRYPTYQPTTATTTGQQQQPSQPIDFSNYSMSVKKSSDPYSRKSMTVNKPKKLNKSPSSSTLSTIPSTSTSITKARRKSKQHNNAELISYVCTECGVKESPEWRKGPKGPKTLCNACGLRWAKWTRQKSNEER